MTYIAKVRQDFFRHYKEFRPILFGSHRLSVQMLDLFWFVGPSVELHDGSFPDSLIDGVCIWKILQQFT